MEDQRLTNQTAYYEQFIPDLAFEHHDPCVNFGKTPKNDYKRPNMY